MPVKSDRNDARGIAQLMRLGWFRPVHCKSMSAQETRTLLTARKLVQSKLRDVENSLRGILRGFGLKVGKTTEREFAGRIEELVVGHRHLQLIAKALLAVRAVLRTEFAVFEKQAGKMARSDMRTRLLMSTPAVGPIVALTYASAIDDPTRFKSSKQAGAHFGLTPKKHQSGETDYTGRISKIGDGSVRTVLYEAAHWAKRSVPTTQDLVIDGGHGAKSAFAHPTTCLPRGEVMSPYPFTSCRSEIFAGPALPLALAMRT